MTPADQNICPLREPKRRRKLLRCQTPVTPCRIRRNGALATGNVVDADGVTPKAFASAVWVRSSGSMKFMEQDFARMDWRQFLLGLHSSTTLGYREVSLLQFEVWHPSRFCYVRDRPMKPIQFRRYFVVLM